MTAFYIYDHSKKKYPKEKCTIYIKKDGALTHVMHRHNTNTK